MFAVEVSHLEKVFNRRRRGARRRAAAALSDLWPLLVLAVPTIPLGLAVFHAGERYAKRHGKLKRSG